MDKRYERLLLSAAAACGLIAGLNAVLAGRTHLLALAAAIPFALLAALAALAVAPRLRLARLEDDERRDAAAAPKRLPGESLFEDGSEADPFTAARSRRLLEHRIVPAYALAFAAFAALAARFLFRRFAQPAAGAADTMLAVPFLAGEAFILFLLSRYLLGLGRAPESRLLRAPGVYVGLASLACLVAGVGAAAAGALPAADRLAARAMAFYLALLAAELVVNTVVDLYRPRRAGEPVANYESRISRLLTDPASWAQSVVTTLDYQFGFRVSETWFFRFLGRALVPLVLFQLAALYALTCLVFIGPEELGVLERFGRRGALLESGFHAKLPWPFETVRRWPARRVLRVTVGYHDEHEHETPRAILWTVPHYPREDYFMLASRAANETASDAVPVNLLVLNVPVEYRITNVFQYGYGFANAADVLAEAAYRCVTMECAARDLPDVMGPGQASTAERLRERLQADAGRFGLGVEILFVGMQGVHPPVAVAGAFESVVGALETRESLALDARTYASRQLPLATAEAAAKLSAARAYRLRRAALAEAEAYRFDRQLLAYKKSPDVFRARAYLGALDRTLGDVRKYVIAADAPYEVIQFNLEDKLRPDLFDFGSTTGRGR